MSVDLIYGGNCNWEPSGEPEPSTPPNELPTTREPWLGRSDQLSSFLSSKAVGSSYLGGYIIDNTPRDNTPFPGVASVDLIIALPPSFSDYTAVSSSSTKTASKSATVSAAGIIEGESEVAAERSATFTSPETRYTYFAATRPTANRFSSPLTSGDPVLKRSVIKASANGKEATFAGGTAPAALVSALAMPPVDVGNFPEAEPIAGTPWFRCTEVWTRELRGD